MKKWIPALTVFLGVIMLLAGFAAQCAAVAETSAPTPKPAATPEPQPLYADRIADGTYAIKVLSSSSMFRVVDAQLKVENGAMTCVMTMSGKGYGKLYMGTGDEALADTEEHYIPSMITAEGAVTFQVPVEALDMDIDCAAWSIRKESWYDRVLVFESALIPPEAIKAE